MEQVGAVNVALVWLGIHQLGYFYAEGLLTKSAVVGTMIATGITLVVLLTVVLHWYPVSMVGLPGQKVSNMNPPTAALAAHAVWLVGLVLALRKPVSRWLNRPRVWAGVIMANSVVMTTFLWHLTALFTLYWACLAIGLPLPTPASAGWWISRPLWLAALGLLCAGFVYVFRWAERPVQIAVRGGAAMLPALGITAVCIGVLGVALSGLEGLREGEMIRLVFLPINALIGLGLISLGWFVLRGR